MESRAATRQRSRRSGHNYAVELAPPIQGAKRLHLDPHLHRDLEIVTEVLSRGAEDGVGLRRNQKLPSFSPDLNLGGRRARIGIAPQAVDGALFQSLVVLVRFLQREETEGFGTEIV